MSQLRPAPAILLALVYTAGGSGPGRDTIWHALLLGYPSGPDLTHLIPFLSFSHAIQLPQIILPYFTPCNDLTCTGKLLLLHKHIREGFGLPADALDFCTGPKHLYGTFSLRL